MSTQKSRDLGKKKALAAALALAMGLGTGSAQAAFTPLPADSRFMMTITGGCFDFGNCQTDGKGTLTDNTTAAEASITTTSQLGTPPAGLPPGTYGSGIVGDGAMGKIEFFTDASGKIHVLSFSQDSYLGTAGGTFFLDTGTNGTSGMTGSIGSSGNMTFMPTGRMGLAASFASTLGTQPWNLDNTSNGLGTGLYTPFTTGTSTNRVQGLSNPFTLTGTALTGAVSTGWTGTLVSAGNIGSHWGSFNNQQYSELWKVKISELPNPVAINDTATTFQAIPVSIDVLANDHDPQNNIDSSTLKIVSTSALASGSTAVVNAGKILYTPAASFLGTESFTYQVADTSSPPNWSNIATVSVTVSKATAKPPVAKDDSLTVLEDGSGTVNVLTNDTAPSGFPVLTVSGNTAPLHGSVVNKGGGNFTYTPQKLYDGKDSFTYTVGDGSGLTATATVNITVTHVNHNPVANNDTVVARVDTPLAIDVLSHDYDPDVGDIISVQSFTQPAHGSVTKNANGTLVYTPTSGYKGSDSFDYTITDGHGGTATAAVDITVISVAFSGPVAPNLPGHQISPDITGGSNFTMLNASGGDIGGTNDIAATWDGTVKTNVNSTTPNMSIATAGPTPFFGFVWQATSIRVFGPGTYKFDACPGNPSTFVNSNSSLGYIAQDGSTNCDPSGNNELTMTVGPKQLGAHMLFNWNKSKNIDVVMVWDINHAFAGSPSAKGAGTFGAKGAVFNLAVIDDNGDGIPGHPMVDGPFKGFHADFNLNLNPPFALPVVTAVATQAGKAAPVVVPSGGAVTITAKVTPGATVTYDWSKSDGAMKAANTNGTTGSTFVFNPAGLPNGPLTARVTITDTATKLQNTVEVPLLVSSAMTLADAQDDNGNGIPNGDKGSALPPTELQVVPNNTLTYLLQSSVGKLKLGTLAQRVSNKSGKFGAGLTAADFPVKDLKVTDSCVGGCFGFVITGVPKGGSAQVVLPLSAAIPANAVYRKFVNGAWRDFFLTGTVAKGLKGGQIASAPGGPGTCPKPGNSAYKPGLTAGDFCVQLTLNDGGRNDADLTKNGVIMDPGGVAGAPTPSVSTVSTVGTPDVGTSGCSISPTPVSAWRGGAWWLIGTVIGWLGFSRRRRSPQRS